MSTNVCWSAFAIVAGFFLMGCATPDRTQSAPSEFVGASDDRISFSDGFPVKFDEEQGFAYFDRILDTPGRGFRWDAPGARMRWSTDSTKVSFRVRFADRHTGTSRNSIGYFTVDGEFDESWSFRKVDGKWREIVIPVPAGGGYHDYEVILPYGDSVDLLGVRAALGAKWRTPAPRPSVRYVAFGDSVTHGFTASSVVGSYAFRLAESMGWELINAGIGGRGTSGGDSSYILGQSPDVVSVLIGVNDWQGGASLESFQLEFEVLLDGVRTGAPKVPVFVMTPLWVPDFWKPSTAKYPLEDYRDRIREVVKLRGDPKVVLVEGPSLIDHDPDNFDKVAVHPNDKGFLQLADRLQFAIEKTLRESIALRQKGE